MLQGRYNDALMALIVFVLVAGCLSIAPRADAQDTFLPDPVKSSDLVVRLDLVGRIPTNASPTSPLAAGSQLLLIDKVGDIYAWDGMLSQPLLTPDSVPVDISLFGAEGVLNVAADPTGTSVFVMFTSSTVPNGIPQRISPRPGADAWQVLYHYDFNGANLSNPSAITALQVRSEGHTGGGLAVLNDGSLLFTTGDNGDAFEDGRSYAQDATNHLSKILRINPADGSTQVVALGVRNIQRLAVYPDGDDVRVDFADIGGHLAEEIDSISLTDLLANGTTHNFGWGRNAGDGQAREGTFYIDENGSPVGAAPRPETGFLQPVAEFGREGETLIAVSGPVSSSQSFSRISSLFGDLTGGYVYALTGLLQLTEQDVFRVNLVDSNLQPVTLNGLTGGQRSDPRFFNFPDGTAGVLLGGTGDFYRLTELTK
jgi:hypothetical protein